MIRPPPTIGTRSGVASANRWAAIALTLALPLVGSLLPGAARAATGTAESPALTSASATPWWFAAAALALLAATCVFLYQRSHRLARELRATRVHAQSLVDMLDVWQWQSDPSHRLTQLRPPQGSALAAWSAAASGHSVWEQFRPNDEPALRACLDAHGPVNDVKAHLTLPDGVVVTCQLRAVALSDNEGGFAGYVGTARVLAAAPAPAPAIASAGAPADSERESFSYTVSHDLRAPIRVVEGFTKILKEDYGRLLDRIGNDHLDRVLGAAARMNSMIDALLALSQLSTQPLAHQPVNMSQLANYLAEDLRRQSPERQVKISIEPDLAVLGDPTLLRVVLENLLGNAWKYTAKRLEPEISFGRDLQKTGVVFSVRDNGAGFDMRFADRLFGVFQRLHSATDFQGTGVGLASVRRIIRRHGGDIWAEAEVDRGASFYFTLGQ
jgi:signal transduction histidine kinase